MRKLIEIADSEDRIYIERDDINYEGRVYYDAWYIPQGNEWVCLRIGQGAALSQDPRCTCRRVEKTVVALLRNRARREAVLGGPLTALTSELG